MATKQPCLPQATIEAISKILGNTDNTKGLSGTEIGQYLSQQKIPDTTPDNTKWKRLHNALGNIQNVQGCSNAILNIIIFVMKPSRYLDDREKFGYRKLELNKVLAFVDYSLTDAGGLIRVEEVRTLPRLSVELIL